MISYRGYFSILSECKVVLIGIWDGDGDKDIIFEEGDIKFEYLYMVENREMDWVGRMGMK